MEKDYEFASDEKLNIENGTSDKKGIKSVAVYVALTVFILLTAGLGIFGFASQDRAFSDSENRVLAQMPDFSWEGLIDGSFMGDFEDYLADQFPLRDFAIRLKTVFNRAVGKREENGVYIGEQGFLFDFQTVYNEADVAKKTAAINSFAKRHPETDILVTIAPNSSYIYSEYLPYGVKVTDQNNQINMICNSLTTGNIGKIDTVGILSSQKQDGELLYYRTDHHWTTRAAYGVFCDIEEYWGLRNDSVNYEFYTVADDFEGTMASTAGVYENKDTIEICIPQDSKETYVVNYESMQVKTATLFSEEKLSTKNKYEVFLGGNYGKLSIETSTPNRNTLLIIKDSYANCMIPMFTPHFSEIVIVDPRYMTEGIETVMDEYDVTHVLFLYNLNTFLEDSSLVETLAE